MRRGHVLVGMWLVAVALIAGAAPPAWAQFTYTQITNSTGGDHFSASINADGTRIAFDSFSDPTGGNPDGNSEIFLWTSDSGITQITTTTWSSNYSASINADGTRIAFYSWNDITGGNADGNAEIFLYTQGAVPPITQITTSTGGGNWWPSINADGTKIAFTSDRDLTGGNPDGNWEIFLWTQSSGITQITNSTGGRNLLSFISSDGTRIAFQSDRDLTGGNADGNEEIFLWTQGSGFTQITTTTGANNALPSINADGTRIAFYSTHDLTGGNPDGNWEIFLWTQGSGITQITNTTMGSNFEPSISSDGTRIAFQSDRDLTGGNADGNEEIFLWTQGSGFTQITTTTGANNALPSINADGTRIAFSSAHDLTGANADGNREIFLAAPTAPTAIPTLSEWAQIGMAALLLGGGLLALRKRSTV